MRKNCDKIQQKYKCESEEKEENESKEEKLMKGVLKQRAKAHISVLACTVLFIAGIVGLCPAAANTVMAASGAIHVYDDTPGDVESSKYTLTANGTEVPVIKYSANGNNFDIARFSSDDATPEYTVTCTEEIETVDVYPVRYYPEDSIEISKDKHSVTFTMTDQLRYAFVMINGGPEDQAGKPYLAIINDPTENEEDIPDPDAENVLNFKTFMEEYLKEHPNSEAQEAELAGITSGGVEYEAGELVANDTAQVRFPDKRIMSDDDATYALQAALDVIYAEGSQYDTLYFPAGTYTWSGLEIRNRNGKSVTIYVEEGALLKNRIQECMQAMEPAIGIWDSSDITISGRGIFDGNGVENYKKDRHDAKDSCHQGGVMIVRSSNVTFNDTYVRDAKQWNWESHGSKGCTLNNIKGLTPYNQPWVDGLDMASAQDLTINGAITLGNDDNFASGHYNPSDGFTNTVPGYDQYNADCLEWDVEDSFNVSVNNTLGWSYSGGNGIRLGHNTYGHQMKNYYFTNVNTTNFQGGDRGITVQNGTSNNHAYPGYEELVFKNCSFDTSRVSKNYDINGLDTNLIPAVTMTNCWFSNDDAESFVNNVANLTITDLYMGGEKVTVSNFANLTTSNITTFTNDWIENQAPVFTEPEETSYEAKVGQEIAFTVAATDNDTDDTVTLSVGDLPDGATFDEEKGTFTWTPSDKQLGNHEVTFTAMDSHEVKTTKTVAFTINDKVGNTAPEFTDFEGNPYSVNAGETLTFTVSATDKDNDTITLSVVGELPRGAEFDAETGKFAWTPSANQTGSREITFEAVDQWGASVQATVIVNVAAGEFDVVDIPATEDVYMASWKDEKNKNYNGNEYLRVRRMTESINDPDTYGLWGEKITNTSNDKDAKISVLKFDAATLKENLSNMEKAELELTLINRRNGSGTDRLMAIVVTDDWNESDVTWNTHPAWDDSVVKYSDEFVVDTNGTVQNNISIISSSYDGTKVTIDVTEFVKNLKDTDTTLSIAVCDEMGYELAFASTEGAAKLDESKNAAPVLRMTVKKPSGEEKEVGRVTVEEDSFVGSWSSDQSKNYGSANFLRAAYSSGSTGVLGTGSGSDNKITYLKFDLSSLDVNDFDRVKLQLTLLGVRKNDAANQDTELLVGVAENSEWTESSITWNNKPQVATSEEGLAVSEIFNLGNVVHNDPAQITVPEGSAALMDVTEFVIKAIEDGKDTLTLVVNINNSNAVMTTKDANRIYLVSREGAKNYPNAEDMAPALVLTKYSSEETPVLSSIEVTGPSVIDYKIGEALNTEGLKVTAYYSDGSSKDITNEVTADSIAGYDSTTAGVKPVTVSYGDQTATFDVAVRVLSEIKIESAPEKTEYILGDELNTDGMEVTAVYALGDPSNEANEKTYNITEEVLATPNAISGFDSTTAGEKSLKVNYESKEADLTTVTVKDELPEDAVLKKLTLTGPNKTEYEAGETLDLTGLKLIGTYDFNETELHHDLTEFVTENQETVISGFDTNQSGEQIVTITVGEQIVTFTVTVNEQPVEPTLNRIEVTVPTKTEYQVGEELNLEGMKVTAYYSDGSTKELKEEDYTVDGFDASTVGNVTITVKYGEQTGSFEVTIVKKNPILNGISLTAPSKAEYTVGEDLDLTGMKVTAIYDDATEKEVTDEAEVTGFDSTKAGEVIVNVTYGGFSQTFTVHVKEKTQEEKPGNDPNEGTDNDGNIGNNAAGDKNTNQTVKGDHTSSGNKAAKTGDESHVAGYILLLILTVAVAVIEGKKKFNCN